MLIYDENASLGSYSSHSNLIKLNLFRLDNDKELKSTLLHEVQHAVQYIEDFAIDNGGNLLVTDALRSDVQVFSLEGKFLKKFGGKGRTPASLEKPEGVAVDPKTGNIFVADYLFTQAARVYPAYCSRLPTPCVPRFTVDSG